MTYLENKYKKIIDQFETGSIKVEDVSSDNVNYYERDFFLECIEKKEKINDPDSKLTDQQDNMMVANEPHLSNLKEHVINLDLTDQIHIITHAKKVSKGDQSGTGPYTQVASEDSIAFLSQLTPSQQPELIPIKEFEKYHQASKEQKLKDIESNKSLINKCKDFLSNKSNPKIKNTIKNKKNNF